MHWYMHGCYKTALLSELDECSGYRKHKLLTKEMQS